VASSIGVENTVKEKVQKIEMVELGERHPPPHKTVFLIDAIAFPG
jgi:hypothetical protein